jgi:hypothetical protein
MTKKSLSVGRIERKNRQPRVAKNKRTGVGGLDLTGIIEKVRQLAWTGQHKLAIDSATQLLPLYEI